MKISKLQIMIGVILLVSLACINSKENNNIENIRTQVIPSDTKNITDTETVLLPTSTSTFKKTKKPTKTKLLITWTSEATSTPTLGEGYGCKNIREAHYSPSGNWLEIMCSDPLSTIITNKKAITWKIDTVDFQLSPFYWTKSEDILYLSVYACPMGAHCDGGGSMFARYDGLFRINLISGQVVNIFGQFKGVNFDFDISKDEKKLAFIELGNSPLSIGIRYIDSWSDDWIELNNSYKETGLMKWADDNNRIIATAGAFYRDEYTPIRFDILLLDIEKHTYRIVLGKTDKFLEAIGWIGPNNVLMKDIYDNESKWVVNVEKSVIAPYSEN